ncbi:MAG: type II toxin-antitoxin system RelE/ParE family toxin [Bacteroidia bacterium]|nr:type II toxin-antitoxin system RelE/ParE family toxin [Bacteroidia bacterium]
MRKVKWNSFAKADYYDNIDYLLKKWTEKEAQLFINEVDEIIYILEQGTVEYQNTDYPNIKRCLVCKQITLFYRIIDNQNIELLRFWNNYQDDKKLTF